MYKKEKSIDLRIFEHFAPQKPVLFLHKVYFLQKSVYRKLEILGELGYNGDDKYCSHCNNAPKVLIKLF